jgi:quinoprotein glucose dehydrogenase
MKRFSLPMIAPALVLGAWAAAVPHAPAAQPASDKPSVWDGVYTEAQAKRGMAAYEQQCSFCHLSDLSGEGFAPALAGETFTSRWEDGTLGDLFIIVKQTMPQDNPASLLDEEYAEIVAYLLKSNRYPAGEQPLGTSPAALKRFGFKRPDGGGTP